MKSDAILEIVIPLFNETANVEKLLSELQEAFDGEITQLRVILVDDGSTDNTWEEIEKVIGKFISRDSQDGSVMNVKGIKLVENVGQFRAIECGLRQTTADFVITMDGDLQHPPLIAKELWNRRKEADTVAARQVKRKDRLIKRVLSKIFYSVIKLLSGLPIENNVSDFRILNRRAINLILKSPFKVKIVRFLVYKVGLSQSLVEYFPKERNDDSGSRYNLRSMIKLAGHALIITSDRLLKLGLTLSLVYFTFVIAVLIYTLYLLVSDQYAPGWISLMITMLVSFFFNFLVLGILSVFMIQIIPNQNRPIESLIENQIEKLESIELENRKVETYD